LKAWSQDRNAVLAGKAGARQRPWSLSLPGVPENRYSIQAGVEGRSRSSVGDRAGPRLVRSGAINVPSPQTELDKQFSLFSKDALDAGARPSLGEPARSIRCRCADSCGQGPVRTNRLANSFLGSERIIDGCREGKTWLSRRDVGKRGVASTVLG